MRRLARWTLNAMTVLSLLLCVAAGVMSCRSPSSGSGRMTGTGHQELPAHVLASTQSIAAATAPTSQLEDQDEVLWRLFQRWDKGTETERREVAIEVMDRGILIHGQSVAVIQRAFGGDFRVTDQGQDGGYAVIYCRRQPDPVWQGWYIGAWFVYLHYKGNLSVDPASSCTVDKYWLSNDDPMHRIFVPRKGAGGKAP
jgi:hypothetical protein